MIRSRLTRAHYAQQQTGHRDDPPNHNIMLFQKAVPALLVVASCCFSTATQIPTHHESTSFCTAHTLSAKDTESAFHDLAHKLLITKEIQEAFRLYVREDLIRHTNNVPGPECQAACTAELWQEIFAPMNFTIWNLAFQDNVGYLHTRAVNVTGDVLAVFDMFRWENGCVVEHWDGFQMRAANATGGTNLF